MPKMLKYNSKCTALQGILRLVSIAEFENAIAGVIRRINDRSITRDQYRRVMRWSRRPLDIKFKTLGVT